TLRVAGGDALSARAPLAVVSPETAFYLPRAYSARLPDLALLASSFYPFSIRADLSDVIVVVPDAPADAAFALVCELSAQLGRLAGDTAFLEAGGPACYRVTRAESFGETPYFTTVEAWLQTHWLALPVLAVAVSAGLFAAVRGALQQYAAAYLASSKGASWRP